MKTELVQLTESDFQDAMDFLNMVFGAYQPHDFETLLPAIYRPVDEAMRCLHALRESGRIRAIVGLYPMSWQVGDNVIQVAGIGGVSTHPKFRHAGYMRRLMNHCLQSMRDTGCQLSYLGGQRQRYGYYGYERCGHALRYTFTRANLRHACGDADTGIRFVPLIDPDQVNRARALHDAQPAHCWRQPGLFLDHLHNWHARPNAAIDGAGDMVGYVVADASGEHLTEVVAGSDDTAQRLIQAWVAHHAAATVSLSTLQPQRLQALGQWCDSVSVLPAGNWQVFDWPAVAGALLSARCGTANLLDGRVVIGIEGMGCLRLQVDGCGAQVTRTNATPDIQCDHLTAMRLLFGPVAPSQVTDLPGAARLLDQWCPLPLSWSRQDGV